MKTLEQVKKEKNYLAFGKGYKIDPEGFPLWFLIDRLGVEYREFLEAYAGAYMLTNDNREKLIGELADMSNFIDFIATKLIVYYPDVHKIDQEIK